MTVVLCGSLGATASIFDAQGPVLAGRVVRVDHPGHGAGPPADVHTVADLAARVLDEGLEPIVDAVLARWFTTRPPDGLREMFLSTDRESYARCCDALSH